MLKILLVSAGATLFSGAAFAQQTCSDAYSICEKNAYASARNKGDSVGWCQKSKATCMQKGYFPNTKYTGRMNGLKKQ